MSTGQTSLEIHELYSNHSGWLRSWLYRRLGNSADAADLMHDTFLRLVARAEPVAAHEPRAFLTTVAKGIVSNFQRRRRLEQAYLATLAQLPQPQVPGPEERALILEVLIEIDYRLDSVEPLVRKAFLLAQLNGMKQTDIARELGVSLATAQRYIVKAAHLCFFGA